jgi:hypothetical protein
MTTRLKNTLTSKLYYEGRIPVKIFKFEIEIEPSKDGRCSNDASFRDKEQKLT